MFFPSLVNAKLHIPYIQPMTIINNLNLKFSGVMVASPLSDMNYKPLYKLYSVQTIKCLDTTIIYFLIGNPFSVDCNAVLLEIGKFRVI